MKISLNWLKDYLNIPLSPDEVSELLTSIGLEVEGMVEVESIKGGLKDIVVGHVIECGKHPNADKLSLTKVSIGKGDDLQIVCGAPNVAEGQKVLVAPVGTTLYTPKGEWTLKKGKIRGAFSEGMICAEDELGLGDDHNGIIVLPEDVPTGTLAKDYYKVETDHVYDIGLTPNRSDATNHIGVAKDLAAALKINHGVHSGVKMPDVNNFQPDSCDMEVEVVVEHTQACPRYSGVTIKGVTIKESPDWLKKRLQAIDVRPISNIVDITNFVLHEFGQPLHAFDLDKIPGQKIIVKPLEEGTPFVSLDEVERKLKGEDLVICDGNSKGMCIAGVFGGISSGVKETTKNIFLESAHFNPKWIRRSSMKHNLRTDAAKVFEKGSDPNITVFALKRAALMMKELAGGEIASEIVDVYPEKIEPKQVTVNFAHVNRLIGVKMPHDEIIAILEAMEMEVIEENAEHLVVGVPTNKADVTREADVIEEILRIYGFNKVPIPNQIRSAITVTERPDPNYVKNTIGDYLTANGFHEMMALSLSQSKYYQDVLPLDASKLVYINNTSNVHLDVMRPEMLISGLETIRHNQNRRQIDLKLYEFGKSYQQTEAGIKERSHLCIYLCGNRQPESWHNKDQEEVGFYTLKTFVRNILTRLGVEGYQESPIQDETIFSGFRYHRGQQVLAEFGKVQPLLIKKMDIRNKVFYAVFEWDNLLKANKKNKIEFAEINKYPSVRRDLALVIDKSVNFSDIVAIARKVGKKILKDINLFDVYENEKQLGADKKSYAVSFTFEDPGKTLKDKEVDKVVNKLIQEYERKLKAFIRR
ncbi:MAG: phenylalanine--tRNA ligase subunit beta [Bacteroidetes bacterium]|nr:phenylalanine--tRNA ligase subunit beta [Bacteroidota bacterium]